MTDTWHPGPACTTRQSRSGTPFRARHRGSRLTATLLVASLPACLAATTHSEGWGLVNIASMAGSVSCANTDAASHPSHADTCASAAPDATTSRCSSACSAAAAAALICGLWVEAKALHSRQKKSTRVMLLLLLLFSVLPCRALPEFVKNVVGSGMRYVREAGNGKRRPLSALWTNVMGLLEKPPTSLDHNSAPTVFSFNQRTFVPASRLCPTLKAEHRLSTPRAVPPHPADGESAAGGK